ncbi:MAG: SH3 domain-containing protein [Drouetiella hepatica Uher 2000/2452]|uniref:SH3 domain-containing protein n=1 Tax=Drouetiella hepatica Uher 2000/2452 TaxID=904376 RepID=A0A951Q775_9CYAN|nr:SH3 domain-containing protein [Drouetiella hepatica Uher 2000/2452]
MTSRRVCIPRSSAEKVRTTLLGVLSLGTLALSACSVADLAPRDVSSSVPSATPTLSASPSLGTSPSASAIASEFTFPQSSCGDQAVSPSESWYPVYIDKSDIAQIRNRYCKDAVSVIRDKTGVPSVQVASFTTYGKAQRFALAVGGEVEPVGISRTSLDARITSQDSQSPDSSTRADVESTDKAVLTSSQPQAPINVRERATTSAGIAHIGYGGDRLSILDKMQGEDGNTWYSVRLESGERGWVRSDFVSQDANASSSGIQSSSAQDPATSGNLDRSLTASASPSASAESSTSGSARSAVLTASEPDALINVRTGASTSAEVQSTGYAGDRIQVVDKKRGEDGETWYSVRFESGTTGWVRSDFVSSN